VSYNEVQRLLEQHVATTLGSAAVAWENVQFAPPRNGTVWYRVTFLPAESQRAAVGSSGMTDIPGVLQVSVFAPVNKGSAAARSAADTLMAALKSGTMLASGGVGVTIQRVGRGPARQEPDWYHIPVRATWISFTTEI